MYAISCKLYPPLRVKYRRHFTIGFLSMINRTKTLSQILGFLIIENGITLMLLFGSNSFSSILEFGLAMDLLIGVLIMGIFSNRIKKDLEHIDVSKLSSLKDTNR